MAQSRQASSFKALSFLGVTLRKGFFQGPPTRKPLHKCNVVDTQLSGPFRERLGPTKGCQPTCVSTVTALLTLGGPLTILRGIVAVIVNALNGMRRRGSGAHVRVKIIKALHPTFAHGDAPTAVIFVLLVLLVSASFAHVCPNPPFWGSTHTVFERNQPYVFFAKAAATLGLATCQSLRGYDRSLTAGTQTIPTHMTRRGSYRPALYKQATEALPNKICHRSQSFSGST